MRYHISNNAQNRKANERLERDDINAGSSNPAPNANQNTNAGSGSSASSGSNPTSNNPSAGNPKPKATKPKYTGLAGGLKDQLKKEARVVEKLPNDFPIDQWESLNTRQQRQTLKSSGLDEKEQWVLLNANAPLRVLDEYNQEQLASGISALAAKVASTAAKSSSPRNHASDNLRSISTPLQKTALQRKLELQREALAERERQAQGQTSVRATLDDGASTRSAANTPVARGSQSSKSSEDDSEEKSLWEKFVSFFENIFSPEETPEPANITPQVVTMVTVPPTASPKPTPTPSPTPGTEERDRMASEGVAFAIGELGKPYSKSGRYGDKGYDCSGLVIAMCEAMHSDLPFGSGIKSTCQYGMSQSFKANMDYGSVEYDYATDITINELQPGDLVFYAKPDNLKKDVHVAIATGEMIYDPETGASWPEVIEASRVSKSVTKQYPAYNIQDGGQFSRSHTKQVITYVIRPNYAWEEQP